MNRTTLTALRAATASAALLAATSAFAGGLDRSGQPIGVIFEDGRYAELSFGVVTPTLSGTDVTLFGSRDTGNIAQSYTSAGAAYKADLNDTLSYAIILDQPYGAASEYETTGSVAFAGTQGNASSLALTALARYELGNGLSFHGGLRAQTISADATLAGRAYGGLSGYTVDLKGDTSYGYVLGAAYERPDIALRVALTYSSEITHDMNVTENGTITGGANASSTLKVTTPDSVNLDFQSGIMADTLLFGSIRWVDWSEFDVSPARLDAATSTPLVGYDSDTITYSLGIGRRINDNLSVAVTLGYEAGTSSDTSSLAPSNGNRSIGLGVTYTAGAAKITAGVRYVEVGDANAQSSNTTRAVFSDNSAVAVGMKVGFTF